MRMRVLVAGFLIGLALPAALLSLPRSPAGADGPGAPGSPGSPGGTITSPGGPTPTTIPGAPSIAPSLQNPTANAARPAPADPSCETNPDGMACDQQQLADLDAARVAGGLPPYEVSTQFFALSEEEKLFVLSNLDRIDFGLPPMAALDVALNQSALQGAQAKQDPAFVDSVDGGARETGGGSSWAEDFTDAMAAYFFWMYADGYGGGNLDCTSTTDAGCWIHRDVTLATIHTQPDDTLLMGAAADPALSSYTEIYELVANVTTPDYELTWPAALQMGTLSRPAPAVAWVSTVSPAVGATISISGYNLAGGSVQFGSTAAPSSTCTALMCTATVPALSGPTDVTVTTSAGTSGTWIADQVNPGGTGDSTNVRIAGPDRIGTSVLASQQAFPTPGSADAVLVATDASFTDSLAAVPLAARLQGPILLTGPASLDSRVAAEISRVLAEGATITLLGGSLAVSGSVLHALQATGHPVVRVGGDTRFDAVLIAGLLSDPQTVIEVDGLDPTDAAGAGPAAAKEGAAILLTNGSQQHHETAAYLAQHAGDSRVTIGGAAAAADPGASLKLVGADRFATAAMVANTFFPGAKTVGIAATPADCLTGGLDLALAPGPMLLVTKTSIPPATQAYLNTDSARTELIAVGGTYVLSDGVVSEASAT